MNHRLKRFWKSNSIMSLNNKAENWMMAKLIKTGYSWTRQRVYNRRIFDFYCPLIKIAIEVDGKSHEDRVCFDKYRDVYYKEKFGVIVLRVRNFNEEDAERAIKYVMDRKEINNPVFPKSILEKQMNDEKTGGWKIVKTPW